MGEQVPRTEDAGVVGSHRRPWGRWWDRLTRQGRQGWQRGETGASTVPEPNGVAGSASAQTEAVPQGDKSGWGLSMRSAEDADTRIHRSAVGQVRGERVELRQSGSLVAVGRDVRVRQGGGGVLAGAKLSIEQGGGQWIVGGLIQARQVFAITVIAARVEGQVRCLFDARGAFAFGAGAALMTGLLRLLLRRR